VRASSERALGSAAPLKPTVGGRKVLGEFVQLMAQTGAQPQLLVRYVREAFLSEHDAYARVTLDRQLQVQRVSGWDLDGDPSRWLDMRSSVGFPSGEPLVVLELKWAGEMPMWMCDLITAFDLNAPGFSKYGQGVETCAGGDEGLSGLRSG
jgi:SPX domain protein involved in polyphosphate accumulation